MKRPEPGAIGGIILVTIVFLVPARPTMFTLAGIMNFLTPATQLGILAVAAAMMMIGGEFDLSIGSMSGVHKPTEGTITFRPARCSWAAPTMRWRRESPPCSKIWR